MIQSPVDDDNKDQKSEIRRRIKKHGNQSKLGSPISSFCTGRLSLFATNEASNQENQGIHLGENTERPGRVDKLSKSE
jgi:hypothetical protein